MSENMPILYKNIMSGLPSDFARDVFLWASDRPENDRMCYRAEKFAIDADNLVKILAPMFDTAAKIHGLDRHDPDLLDFILKRHANFSWGGNVAPSYASGFGEA